jgi:hypothetical protein
MQDGPEDPEGAHSRRNIHRISRNSRCNSGEGLPTRRKKLRPVSDGTSRGYRQCKQSGSGSSGSGGKNSSDHSRSMGKVHMGVHTEVHTGVHKGVHMGLHKEVYKGLHKGVHRGVHMGVHTEVHTGVHKGVHKGVHTGVHRGQIASSSLRRSSFTRNYRRPTRLNSLLKRGPMVGGAFTHSPPKGS